MRHIFRLPPFILLFVVAKALGEDGKMERKRLLDQKVLSIQTRAEQGTVKDQVGLGKLYRKGQWVDPDCTKAMP